MSVASVDLAPAEPPSEDVDAATSAPNSSAATLIAAPDSPTELSGGLSAVMIQQEVAFLDASPESYEQLLAALTEETAADSNFTLVLLD